MSSLPVRYQQTCDGPAAAVNVYQAKEGEVACSVIVKFQFTREGASDQY
jgi:hypothetical protein